MRNCHARFEAMLGDIDKATAIDVDFHALIARATQNDLFSVLLGSIGDALIEVRHETLAGRQRPGDDRRPREDPRPHRCR